MRETGNCNVTNIGWSGRASAKRSGGYRAANHTSLLGKHPSETERPGCQRVRARKGEMGPRRAWLGPMAQATQAAVRIPGFKTEF